MALDIKTFNQQTNTGEVFFKAVGHPLLRHKLQLIKNLLLENTRVYAFDPDQNLTTFNQLAGIDQQHFSAVFVQSIEQLTSSDNQPRKQLITDIINTEARVLFVPVFDEPSMRRQIEHLLPNNCQLVTLNSMKLDPTMIVDADHYLNPINFITNFALFRHNANLHTRISTVNSWSSNGIQQPKLWCCLLDESGMMVQDFSIDSDHNKHGHNKYCIDIDSQILQQQYGINDFNGQLFMHAIGVAKHPMLKYLLYMYTGNENNASITSFTHDANAWPSNYYSGLPAPNGANQSVILWLQNPHPCAIQAQSIGLAPNGSNEFQYLNQSIPAFGTVAVNVSKILPNTFWPQHIEVFAGKHLVRPRYEITNTNSNHLLSHINIEPEDLATDNDLQEMQKYLGKGYILTAPILPKSKFKQFFLPAPMSRQLTCLPIAALIYNTQGKLINREYIGNLPRNHSLASNINHLAAALQDNESGSIQLIYDFQQGGMADGWLHAIFRYIQTDTGHTADTSFGTHIFNLPVTYKNEPQSYSGKAPGLTTNLFLKLAFDQHRTYCHLIYPVSNHWHPTSATQLTLYSAKGEKIASKSMRIHANGHVSFFVEELFEDLFTDGDVKNTANGYVIIEDHSCRLFGYHGVIGHNVFALDHLFGF